MTIIGHFTQDQDGTFHGALRSLTLQVTDVEIRPVEAHAEKAPSHRVFAHGTEIGAAWTIQREGRPPCLSLQLDDPSFPSPVYGLLLAGDDGVHELRWSRRSAS